jgi:putative ABC transport system permease protein
LSQRLWQRRYNADPQVVGKTIVLNEAPHVIVGVMPEAFRMPLPDIELWSSLAAVSGGASSASVGDWITNRSLNGYRVSARLKDGASLAQARAEMDTIAARLRASYPDANAGHYVSLVTLREQMLGNVRTPMLVLLAAVGFVLLLACANVADLALVRATGAAREVAVRRSLGAADRQLVGQVLAESALLGLLGGAFGLLVAFGGLQALVGLSPVDIPRLDQVAIDARVLAFTFAVSLLAGLLFGLAPAIQLRRADVALFLRETAMGAVSHARARRWRAVLVVGEVAVALVLLAGAGLMLRSFERLRSVDPGFRAGGVLTARVFFSRQIPPPAELVAHYERIFGRLRSLPGVIAAGGSTSLPPNLIQRADSFAIEGRPAPEPGRAPTAIYIPVTADYFRALGAPLLRGRCFEDADAMNAPAVAMINQSLARRHFVGEEAVGRRLSVSGVSRTIVGVVGDVKYEGLHGDAGQQIYVPYAQSPFPGLYAVIRAAGDPLALAPAVRDAIRAVDPGSAALNVRTMEDVLSGSISTPRFHTVLLSLFGAVALFLAAIGVYGVMAYSVAQRTREIGIRMALGAEAANVLTMILREGLGLVGAGLVIGIVGALLATRALAGLLFQVEPHDPLTLGLVGLVLLLVALLACYVPARRATRVDPMVALRYE